MKNVSVGGQAVMEGVMMKTLRHMSVAVRKNNKKIVTKSEKLLPPRNALLARLYTMPFTRGAFNLYDITLLGIRTLIWSAQQNGEEEEKISNKEVFWMLFVSLLITLVIFLWLPYMLTGWLGFGEVSNPILFNGVDAIIKMVFFIGYVLAISMFDDIKRLFQYHGAEHKAVYCFEHNLPLNVKNVQSFSTKHPRCGTSFLMLVIIISIGVFVFLPIALSAWLPGFVSMPWYAQKGILFTLRILCIPFIAGISYELLKIGGKFHENPFMKILIYPGILMQYLTTKEPFDDQVEVAIVAIKKVLKQEGINAR